MGCRAWCAGKIREKYCVGEVVPLMGCRAWCAGKIWEKYWIGEVVARTGLGQCLASRGSPGSAIPVVTARLQPRTARSTLEVIHDRGWGLPGPQRCALFVRPARCKRAALTN